MSKFLVDKLQKLSPYTPGEQPKEREYVKLNTNESPFPPSQKALKYLDEQGPKLNLYPDPDCKELVKVIAEKYGVNEDNVICTNGSDEVLNFAFMAYCDKDKPACFADITYGFYKVFASVNNLSYKEIALREDFSLSVDDYINEKGTVFIANPNAPTGKSISLSDIERLLKSNRDRVVVIDQAYVDFGGTSAVSLIKKYDNLLVTETFSKSRSMAGARLGFGIADKKIIEDLNRIRYSLNPYNVNRLTMYLGIGAMEDEEYFRKNCLSIIENREFVTEELFKLGFEVIRSSANFVFAKNNDISGEELYKRLKERGVLVRHFTLDRIKEYNRITIGTREQMEVLIRAIKSILQGE